jgi:hypothetical protein
VSVTPPSCRWDSLYRRRTRTARTAITAWLRATRVARIATVVSVRANCRSTSNTSNTVDAGDGVMVGISVFEHKDAEEQTNFEAGDFVAEHLEPLLPNRPQVTTGEVVAYKAG